jgi:hypothetical protein
MIVLPGTRWSGANVDGTSASGRTAPTIGFSRPDRTRSARSASRNRSGSTTKKIARPSAGRTFGGPMIVTSVPPARTSGGRALEDFAADHVERDVDLAGVLQPAGLQVHERVRTQAEGGLPVPGTTGADHAGSHLVCELHRD